MDQDVRVLKFHYHLIGIGDEVRREIAAIKLHAFDDVEFGFEAFGFFNRDHAFFADLIHGLGNDVADLALAVGRNRADLGDLFVRLDLLGHLGEFGDDGFNSLVDAALQVHRVHAGGHRLRTFANDGLRQHGRGGGAVAGEVVGLVGDFFHHLRAHVLELIAKFDFLGHGHAVLGDTRSAERLFDDDVTALGAERHLHCVGENVDAAQHTVTRVRSEFYVFSCHVLSLSYSRTG